MGRGAGRKIVPNAIFHGKRHKNQILKVNILSSRNFVVMAQAPIFVDFHSLLWVWRGETSLKTLRVLHDNNR